MLLLRAYVGDTMVSGSFIRHERDVVWTLSGHTFLIERYASDANRKNSIHIGIAERYDLVVPQAGGPRHLNPATTSTSTDALRTSPKAHGVSFGFTKWSLPHLTKLPAGVLHRRDEIPKALPVCPSDAPLKNFNVVAMDYPAMTFNAEGTRGHRGGLRAEDSNRQS